MTDKSINTLTIGYGPGMCGSSFKSKPQDRFYTFKRRFYKYFIRPKYERKYIQSIISAIQNGFRWIDYSCAYGDGRLIGKAIKDCGVKRNDLMITTRVSNTAQYNHNVREEFMCFLQNAGLDYVDVLQFHWPVTDCYLDAWKEMEKLYEDGYVRHLGVANCHQHHLEEIYKICKYKPEIGQFEIHPLFTQKPLIKYYKQHGIKVCAYTSIARFDDRLVQLPKLKAIAEKYGKNVIQVVLRWHLQNGITPIVHATTPKHQIDNLNVFDFELSDEEMKTIDSFNINSRLRYDPDNCDFSIL